MEMTENEICRNYRRSKNKIEQLQILADLNSTSRASIVKIIIDNGENVRIPVYGKKWEQIKKMSDKQYAAVLEKMMKTLKDKIRKMEEQYNELEMVLKQKDA